MNIANIDPQTLQVTGITELSGGAAGAARDRIKAAIGDSHQTVEVDLSGMTFVDSSGLGALISLHKLMRAKDGHLLLVNPTQVCRQLFELTRLHRTFEIVTR